MPHDELQVDNRGNLKVVSVADEGDPAPEPVPEAAKPDPLDHDFNGKKGGSLPHAEPAKPKRGPKRR